MIEKYTALYSPLDREYQQEYSGRYEDLSFKSDYGEIVAGLKDNKITGFGRPMVCVGTDRFQQEQIERLWAISNDIFYQDFITDGAVSPITRFLLLSGYRARPYFTQIIDLTRTVEELHADLRKSYKSLVSDYLEKCRFDNIFFLQDLHFKCAERKTRNDRTWEIQQEMINSLTAVVSESLISASLFYHNKDWAYYAVSAGEQGHNVIWNAIMYLRAIGCKFLELGEQVYSGDEKAINISKFKRGFGGICKVRLNLTKD